MCLTNATFIINNYTINNDIQFIAEFYMKYDLE